MRKSQGSSVSLTVASDAPRLPARWYREGGFSCPHEPPTENVPPPQRASGRRPPSVAERTPKLRAHRSAIRKSLALQA